MSISVLASSMPSTSQALDELFATPSQTPPNYVLLYPTEKHDISLLQQSIKDQWPEAKLLGATTCQGVIDREKFYSNEGWGLGAMLFSKDNLTCGMGLFESSDGFLAGKNACEEAIEDADSQGELPDLIWIHASPGIEERAIKGIQDCVGEGVPIVGGTCADNNIEGHWKLFDREAVVSSGVALVAIYSEKVISSFLSGYYPTEKKGTVTSAKGRKVIEIDHKPAAQVYDQWVDHQLGDFTSGDAVRDILSETTLAPLGREITKIKDCPFYLLSHPQKLLSGGVLTFFTDLNEGDQITLMDGSIEAMQEKAGTIISSLMRRENITEQDIEAVLLVYCAGCMYHVQAHQQMNEITREIRRVIRDKPVLGIFTFGEQGCFPNAENRHGNLMVSSTLFLK